MRYSDSKIGGDSDNSCESKETIWLHKMPVKFFC